MNGLDLLADVQSDLEQAGTPIDLVQDPLSLLAVRDGTEDALTVTLIGEDQLQVDIAGDWATLLRNLTTALQLKGRVAIFNSIRRPGHVFTYSTGAGSDAQ